MTWFKVDDGFWSHPKVLDLSPEAIALWVRSGSYSGKHLTDGYMSESAIVLLRGTPEQAQELVEAGLWTRAVNGWHFHDWADYQDTRDMVEKRRESWRSRQNRHRNNSPLLNEEPVHSIPFHSKGTRDTNRDTTRESRRDTIGDTFNEFWNEYPRKQGKEAARKAFIKAATIANPEVIIEGAKRYASDPNRKKEFTAHAATWLNAGRWDDEPEPERGGNQASMARTQRLMEWAASQDAETYLEIAP
jgi:hypothetical protein